MGAKVKHSGVVKGLTAQTAAIRRYMKLKRM